MMAIHAYTVIHIKIEAPETSTIASWVYRRDNRFWLL
jgi:hypothetical protein